MGEKSPDVLGETNPFVKMDAASLGLAIRDCKERGFAR